MVMKLIWVMAWGLHGLEVLEGHKIKAVVFGAMQNTQHGRGSRQTQRTAPPAVCMRTRLGPESKISRKHRHQTKQTRPTEFIPIWMCT